MALPLREARGPRALAMPFAVSPLQVRRAALRRVRAIRVARVEVRLAAEDQALLDAVRRELARRARGEGRKSKLRTAAYLASPEGRRAMRVVAALSERIAVQEARLCG